MYTHSLLSTKFQIPKWRAELIARPRLFEQLQKGLEEKRKLTLISAPAGYGKTTQVAEWTTAIESSSTEPKKHLSWLSLDKNDNDRKRFFQYFLAALEKIDESVGELNLSVQDTTDDPEVFTPLSDLLNALSRSTAQLVLVLDDFHHITKPDILAAMEYFIDHQPDTIHLVLITRSDPHLPLARLRARRQMTELRAHDLRFTLEEARNFFGLVNLPLAEQALSALEERTEGWAAGLQLAALALPYQTDPEVFIENFRGSHRYILDYLAGEVIHQLDEEVRTFLMQTSLLDRFNGELCNAVTTRDDSQKTIAWLEQSNMFIIPLDDERCWYRYHHLFAEFLKGQLQHTQADDLPELHHRAAQWFEFNDYPEEALEHAFTIPDYPYASRLVVDNWRRIYHQGRLNTAVEWLDSLPPDFVRQSPPLGVAYCWTLFVRGDYDRIEKYLDEITQTFEQMVGSGQLPREHTEYNIVLQQVILLRAVVMRHHGDVAGAIKEIEQLLPTIEGLRQTLGPVVADMGYTACYSQMGYSYVAAGDLKQAADFLSRVSPHARRCGNFLALAHTTIELARISLLLGRLEQAEKICRDELELADKPVYADYPAFCLVHLGLANVLREKKSWDEAEHHLQKGLETAQKSGHLFYLAQGYLIAARLHHMQGKTIEAQEDLHQAERIAGIIHNRFLDDAVSQTRQEIAFKSASAPTLFEPLSDRELEVLRLICAGKSNQEIADELFIALDTVKRHANNLYGKLGIRRRSQAIIEARKLGLV
jgi:LuxR family maltose regulon positive regulatory protein